MQRSQLVLLHQHLFMQKARELWDWVTILGDPTFYFFIFALQIVFVPAACAKLCANSCSKNPHQRDALQCKMNAHHRSVLGRTYHQGVLCLPQLRVEQRAWQTERWTGLLCWSSITAGQWSLQDQGRRQHSETARNWLSETARNRPVQSSECLQARNKISVPSWGNTDAGATQIHCDRWRKQWWDQKTSGVGRKRWDRRKQW